jgi:hypothetical protein
MQYWNYNRYLQPIAVALLTDGSLCIPRKSCNYPACVVTDAQRLVQLKVCMQLQVKRPCTHLCLRTHISLPFLLCSKRQHSRLF